MYNSGLVVLYWFSLVTTVAGLLGFSFSPKYEESYDSYLKYIVTFYLIADFGFFIHGIAHYLWGTVIWVEFLLTLLLLIASLYLANSIKLDKLEPAKFRDALVYGSVLVLIGKNLPFDVFPTETSLIMAIIAIAVFWLALYLYYVVRGKSLYFDFPEYSNVISGTFFVVYITGLSCLLVKNEKIHFTLDAVSSAILLYILYKIYDVAKPFIK